MTVNSRTETVCGHKVLEQRKEGTPFIELIGINISRKKQQEIERF